MRNAVKTPAKKVLIVEDEGDISLLMNIILSDDKIELEYVKTLADAETYLKNTTPAVILLDNKLPDGLGIDFLPQFKEIAPSSKIIMVSGFAQAAGDLALENGADLYLTKPFTRNQLLTAVHSFTD